MVVVAVSAMVLSVSSAAFAMSFEEMMAAREAKKKAGLQTKIEQTAEVKATEKKEAKEVAFDVEDPSTWGRFTKNVKNVRGYDNGLVGTMTKTVTVTLPKDTIILAINTPSKTIKGEGTIRMESGKDFTVWFAQAVKPGKRPNIQRESDARVVDLADRNSAREFCVIETQGDNGIIVTVDDVPVRIKAGSLPENVEKVLFPGQTFLGKRTINGQQKQADAIEDDIVLYRGAQFSIYYFATKKNPVAMPDVNGQPVAVAAPKVDISKNFSALKSFGEFWDVDRSKGKGRVFMAHQGVSFTVPSWVAKVDMETGPVFGGKVVTLTAGQQCTFWGKKAINKR